MACATDCMLWEQCGGSATAPCACVWTAPDRRHKCNRCELICRERGQFTNTDSGDTFRAHVADGLPLDLLHLHQHGTLHLPVFIPARTQELPSDMQLPLSWAAVDAKTLFTRHQGSPVQARPFLQTPEATRFALRVPPNTKLIAVLNGRDDLLEGFWGMPWKAFLNRLTHAGFSAVTGPTFSINSEDTTPASHNVLMLLRHNRVMAGIQAAGNFPIPNLYWRTERDRLNWIKWLIEHPSVTVVSRDFSRTKPLNSFRVELDGILQIIRGLRRPMHVILLGVSTRKAAHSIRSLTAVGATSSFVSAYPVMVAIKHGLALKADGLSPPKEVESTASRFSLAAANIAVMHAFLTELSRVENGPHPDESSLAA